MRSLALLSLALFSVLTSRPSEAQAPAGFKLVVHPQVPVRALSRAQATAYFLKRSTRFADVAAHPVDLPESSPVRAAFSEAVLHKPTSIVLTYWQQRVASGRDVPPPQKATDAEVLAYVRNTEGAIGYVSESADTSGVRVLPLLD